MVWQSKKQLKQSSLHPSLTSISEQNISANETVGCSAAVAKRQITFAVKDPPPSTHPHTNLSITKQSQTSSLLPLFLPCIPFSPSPMTNQNAQSESHQRRQVTVFNELLFPPAPTPSGIATSQSAREQMFNTLKNVEG